MNQQLKKKFASLCEGNEVMKRTFLSEKENGDLNKKLRGFYCLEVIGEGSSCIVYDAEYLDSQDKLHKIRLKECFPYGKNVSRENGMLIWPNDELKENTIEAFKETYYKMVGIQGNEQLGDDIPHVLELIEANNTAYIIMDFNNTVTFDRADISLHKILVTIKLLSEIVGKYHEIGFIIQDIKSENFSLYEGNKEHVYLFDINSITKLQELKDNRELCYSERTAAPEQKQHFVKQIGRATDIYAIGCCLFEKIMGRQVDSFFDTKIHATWNFNEALGFDNELCNTNLQKIITKIFRKSLNSVPKLRYQTTDELIEDLNEAINIIEEKEDTETKRKFRKAIVALAIVLALAVAIIVPISKNQEPHDLLIQSNHNKEWEYEEVSTEVGEILKFRVNLNHISQEEEESVVRIDLPQNIEYVSGSTYYYDKKNADGIHSESDAIVSVGGLPLGVISEDDNAYLEFEGLVVNSTLEKGNNLLLITCTLTNGDSKNRLSKANLIVNSNENSSAWGWGDSMGGRQSYTIDEINCGVANELIIFNSISDSVIGDEKNFVAARKKGFNLNNVWHNIIAVEEGQRYLVRMYVHNNNPGGMKAVAKDVRVTFALQSPEENMQVIDGFIDSSNATPDEYWDGVVFKADRSFSLKYVRGSARLENNGIGAKGYSLSDDIVSPKGVMIGYKSLNGKLPGCYEYACYVCIEVEAVFDK